MSPLSACPMPLLCLMGAMGLLLTGCAVFILVEGCILHVGTRRTVTFALQAIAVEELTRACVIVLRRCAQGWPGQGLSMMLMRLPTLMTVALFVLLGWAVLGAFVRLRALRLDHITPDSVKEALDALPDGVCYSTTDGAPILVNARMDMLAHDAFGSPVKDEADLWRQLVDGDCRSGYKVELGSPHEAGPAGRAQSGQGMDVRPILLAPDGEAWQFSRSAITVNGRRVVETIAANVTEEHALLLQLEDRNQRLERVNEQLRAYGRDVARLTREEELLAAKVRVHDEVGRALVALRVYERREPSQRDREGLLRLWRGIEGLLLSASKEEASTDDWELLLQAAKAIDVRLELEGELPCGRERALVIALVHECLNNAVRHGEAHRVTVRTSHKDDAWRIDVINDGKAPEAPVGRWGGLANIRTAVERSGGTLEVQWTPCVTVTARLAQGM